MQSPLKESLLLRRTADGYFPELSPNGFRTTSAALEGQPFSRRSNLEKISGMALVVLLHLAVGYVLVKNLTSGTQIAPIETAHLQMVPAAAKLPVAADPTPHETPAPKPVTKPHPKPVVKKQAVVHPKPVVSPIKQVIAAAPTQAEQPDPVQETPTAPAPLADPTPSQTSTQTEARQQPAPAGGQGGKADVAEATPASFDANYLHNPKPIYPRVSRTMHEEGRVMLRVQVSTDGRPLQVEINKSSGFSRLDRAARNAVTQWQFVPAKQGQKPITSWVIVPITFDLSS